MITAKVPHINGAQHIVLPEEIYFPSKEAIIKQVGNAIIAIPKDSKSGLFVDSLDSIPSKYISEYPRNRFAFYQI